MLLKCGTCNVLINWVPQCVMMYVHMITSVFCSPNACVYSPQLTCSLLGSVSLQCTLVAVSVQSIHDCFLPFPIQDYILDNSITKSEVYRLCYAKLFTSAPSGCILQSRLLVCASPSILCAFPPCGQARLHRGGCIHARDEWLYVACRESRRLMILPVAPVMPSPTMEN